MMSLRYKVERIDEAVSAMFDRLRLVEFDRGVVGRRLEAFEARLWADDVGATGAVGPALPSQATERQMLRKVIALFDGQIHSPSGSDCEFMGNLAHYIGHIRSYLDATEPKGVE